MCRTYQTFNFGKKAFLYRFRKEAQHFTLPCFSQESAKKKQKRLLKILMFKPNKNIKNNAHKTVYDLAPDYEIKWLLDSNSNYHRPSHEDHNEPYHLNVLNGADNKKELVDNQVIFQDYDLLLHHL